MNDVTVTYMDDFKGENVIEIAGNSDGLMKFYELLDTFSNLSNGDSVELNQKPIFKISNIKIKILLVKTASGMFRTGSDFEWRISRRKLRDITCLVKEVAEADFPCHQYLDESGEIVVMVSNGETR